MSLEINIRQDVPKEFARGQTLEFVMELPPTIPANWFKSAAVTPATAAMATLTIEAVTGSPIYAIINGVSCEIDATGMTATQAATTLAAVINGLPESTLVTAEAIGNQIHLTATVLGDIGNHIPLTVAGMSATAMSGGADSFYPITTDLAADLRRLEQAGPEGFIAHLNPVWEPNSKYTKIRFFVSDTETEDWPLGPAEFDVMFVRKLSVAPGARAGATIQVGGLGIGSTVNVTISGITITAERKMTFDQTATALAEAINTALTNCTAVVHGTVVTVMANEAGPQGNEITLETSVPTMLTLSSPTFIGGVNAATTSKKYRSLQTRIVIKDGVTA